MRALVAVMAAILLLPMAVHGQAGGNDVEPIGDWYYINSQDPMNDADRSVAFGATSDMEFAFGVKCMRSGARVLVLLQAPMDRMKMISMEEAGRVQYRFGSQDPVGPDQWSLDQENGALMAPGSETSRLIDGFRKYEEVAVRVFNSDGEHVRTETLSLMGATRSLDRLTCVQ